MQNAFEKYNSFQIKFYKGIEDLIGAQEIKLRKEFDRKLLRITKAVEEHKEEFDNTMDTLGGDPAGRKNQMIEQMEKLESKLKDQEVLITHM